MESRLTPFFIVELFDGEQNHFNFFKLFID